MNKNTLLNIAVFICKFSRLIYILIFLILTGIFIHFQVSPSSYENSIFKTKIDNNGGIYYSTSSHKINVDGKVPEDTDVFVLNKLKKSSLYYNYVKLSIALLLLFLCAKEFQNVIESVKEIRTFQKKNILSFKKIGKYILIIAVLMSYSSYSFQQGESSGFQITFTPLILSLLAYIMSEIFKEGYKLSEENKLTV